MTIDLRLGNTLDLLRETESESVQCVVTSPPYWGLRAYGTQPQIWLNGKEPCVEHEWVEVAAVEKAHNGDASYVEKQASNNGALRVVPSSATCPQCGAWRGELGLEPTPELYVKHLVQIFREVRRVLKEDGVLFLNLGDSYYSNPGNGRGGGSTLSGGKPHLSGAPRVVAYGTSGKAPKDYQVRDCLCGSLCDVCRVVYQSDKSHNGNLLVAMLTASLSAPIREHTASQSDHLPTSDSFPLAGHNANAIGDRLSFSIRAIEPLRASLVSMLGESDSQLLDVCLQRASHGECLLCARSLDDCARESFCSERGCICDIAKKSEPSIQNKLGKVSLGLAYPYYTTESLKPKDLVGIPWMVAFALRADGYYLRQDIIWNKPNPMPESVRDRCTKAHEYIFLLTKNQRYYYDADAIREPLAESSIERVKYGMDSDRPSAGINGIHVEKMGSRFANPAGRNKRSVWTVTTKPFRQAHFATFPEKLIEPCILAGSRVGDTILDPFNGAGTSGVVAVKNGRNYIGFDLKEEYLEMSRKRFSEVQMPLI